MENKLLDIMLENQKHLQNTVEKQIEEISKLRIEIKSTFFQYFKEEEAKCENCKTVIDNKLSSKVGKWTMALLLTLGLAFGGFVGTLAVTNSSSIKACETNISVLSNKLK